MNPNQKESGTFSKNEIRCMLKIRLCLIRNVTAEASLNSSTLIDGGLLCFLYFFENNHNYFNCSLLVRLCCLILSNLNCSSCNSG